MRFNFPPLIALAFAASGAFHMARATAPTKTSLPAILYPTGLPVINYLDTIVVTYESSWPGGTNLSANCQEALDSTELCWIWALNPGRYSKISFCYYIRSGNPNSPLISSSTRQWDICFPGHGHRALQIYCGISNELLVQPLPQPSQ
jgi:hypothetical protein